MSRDSRVLVVGASGATGSRLVLQLLKQPSVKSVRVLVRNAASFRSAVARVGGNTPFPSGKVDVVECSVLELTPAQLVSVVEGCTAIGCCLGHTMNREGIFGEPKYLVRDAVRRLCAAVKESRRLAGKEKSSANKDPVRFVLMNTVGVVNPDIDENRSLGARLVLGALARTLAPHYDNMAAAEVLRSEVEPESGIEWVVVRPDALLEGDEPTPYVATPKPLRDCIFNPGTTSRVNVAKFMAELATADGDDGSSVWNTWKHRHPVLYDAAAANAGTPFWNRRGFIALLALTSLIVVWTRIA